MFLMNEKIKGLLEEYLKTDNSEFLKTAIRIQIEEIYPEVRNRSMLENETREVIINKNAKINVDGEMMTAKQDIYTLFNYPVEISKIVHNLKEEPRVIKYQFDK